MKKSLLFLVFTTILLFSCYYIFDGQTFSLMLLGYILIAVVFGFILISLRVRKKGGAMMTTTFGAMDGFYNIEQKQAIETTLERKIGNQSDEQTSGKDQDK